MRRGGPGLLGNRQAFDDAGTESVIVDDSPITSFCSTSFLTFSTELALEAGACPEDEEAAWWAGGGTADADEVVGGGRDKEGKSDVGGGRDKEGKSDVDGGGAFCV